MKNTLAIRDLGPGIPYTQAMSVQRALHRERVADRAPDTLLLLEHLPVYTLGRSADRANLLWDPEEYNRRGIELRESSRGGDVTYHGPGQLVGYPVIRLAPGSRQVLSYVHNLETVLIRTVADFSIRATRDRRNRGLWVGNAKLAALGVRVSRGVTMHGFALNLKVNPEAYGGIVACGLVGATVTSMHLLLPQAPPASQVKKNLVRHFRQVFGYPPGAD